MSKRGTERASYLLGTNWNYNQHKLLVRLSNESVNESNDESDILWKL